MAFKRKARTKVDPPADSSASPLKVTEPTIERLTDVFKLLADRNRLKIVMALGQHGKMHVSALCDLLGQSQPAVSHHLTLMRSVKLIKYDREGKHNFYYLNTEFVSNLLEHLFSDVGAEQALEFDEFNLTISRQGE
jgi:ArsR family transcriptional regulator